MKHKNRRNQTHEPTAKGSTASQTGAAEPASPTRSINREAGILAQAARLAEGGRYERAMKLLRKVRGPDERVINATGVCLLRLGRVHEAIQLFRGLVLAPGCTWMRPGPIIYKTNYATALLLAQHPAGCSEILEEIGCDEDPAVRALRSALRRWESQLSWWQKLNWRIGRVEPRNRPVTIDFSPGEFGLAPAPSETPGPTAPPAPGNRAA